MPSLDLHLVPAITLTGNIGDSVRLDYINQFGPTNAWVTLDTVTLTNTSQLYFDVSAPGQPQRLYRWFHHHEPHSTISKERRYWLTQQLPHEMRERNVP